MGSLHYDGREFEIEDRALAHLQIIISTKLRRRECFFLTWVQPQERGSGRHTIWIDNGVAMHIFLAGSRAPMINRAWIDEMLVSSSRAGGLQLGDEPESPAGGSPTS